MKRWLIVTLIVSSTLVGCAESRFTSVHFEDPQTKVDVEYRLAGAHPYLAEFHRTFRVRFARGEREFPLEMDTGGYLLMNVYRLPEQRLLFDDGADYVIIDCARETIEQVQTAPPAPAQFLGCFDWPQGSTLQFIPSDRRSEQRPQSRRADAST